jgi:hypothetical protein
MKTPEEKLEEDRQSLAAYMAAQAAYGETLWREQTAYLQPFIDAELIKLSDFAGFTLKEIRLIVWRKRRRLAADNPLRKAPIPRLPPDHYEYNNPD